jgi:hypothetical protein
MSYIVTVVHNNLGASHYEVPGNLVLEFVEFAKEFGENANVVSVARSPVMLQEPPDPWYDLLLCREPHAPKRNWAYPLARLALDKLLRLNRRTEQESIWLEMVHPRLG